MGLTDPDEKARITPAWAGKSEKIAAVESGE